MFSGGFLEAEGSLDGTVLVRVVEDVREGAVVEDARGCDIFALVGGQDRAERRKPFLLGVEATALVVGDTDTALEATAPTLEATALPL